MKKLTEIILEADFDINGFYFALEDLNKMFLKFALLNNKAIYGCNFSYELQTKELAKATYKEILEELSTRSRLFFRNSKFKQILVLKELNSDEEIGLLELSISRDNKTINLSSCMTSESMYNYLLDIKKKHKSKEKKTSEINTLMNNCEGELDIQYIHSFDDYVFEEENYEKEAIEKFYNIVEQLTTKNPKGRLTVINGRPGTGKTNYIKGLITKCNNCKFVIVPFNITNLNSPNMLRVLINSTSDDDIAKPLVLVLEDADNALVPRDAANVSEISTLLNMTDGILGHAMDLRIIATTNAKTVELDAALVRPGRLLEMVNIEELSKVQANCVWSRITNTDSEYPFDDTTLAAIYANANKENPTSKEKDVKTSNTKKVMGFGR